MDQINIYTDGAAKGNPGPGGYGVILEYNGIQKEMSEGFRLTTNNRMELLAVIVGLENIKQKGYKIKVGKFPFLGNGKAIALGDDEGMIKTIFDEKTGALLGAHMIGPEVTELIQGYVVAQSLETTEAELMQTIFPHPTLSEAMHESVLDAYGRAIHF